MNAVRKRVTMAAVIGLALVAAVPARAERHRGGGVAVPPSVRVYRPFYFDGFWGPWYPYWYPFGYTYAYPIRTYPHGSVRTEVTPKDTGVYVDGYYAGEARDFNGVFKRLHVVPGGHAITLYLNGYRTVTENIYVKPDSTFKLKSAMEPLAAGEASAPVPAPSRPPAQSYRSPRV